MYGKIVKLCTCRHKQHQENGYQIAIVQLNTQRDTTHKHRDLMEAATQSVCDTTAKKWREVGLDDNK